jgi:hypothetical protein
MADAVHLSDIRCDGAGHGGCQAGCLIFWKEAWLERADVEGPRARLAAASKSMPGHTECTEDDILRSAGEVGTGDSEATYTCQSTKLCTATTPLPWWDVRQYVEDLTSGNVKPGEMATAFLFFLSHNTIQSGLGLASLATWVYDTVQRLWGGTPYPYRRGRVPRGQRTPAARLDLEPGERVRVRPYTEILETLDEHWKNRGLYFDPEHVPFCEGTYSVLRRVERIIDEKTGKMLNFKSDAVILKDVVCEARYAKCRRFCPRAIYPYWREIWLQRPQ